MASPTKALVREFIRKLQTKAIAAVEKKHSALFDEAVVVYLSEENPCLRDSMSNCQELLEKANAIIIEVRALVSGTGWIKRNSWSVKPDVYGHPNIKQMLFSSYVPVGSRLEKVHFDWAEEKDRVIASYDALFRYLENNSASATVKYLVALGFDVTWINDRLGKPLEPEKSAAIDPKNLFVCGENGA